MSNTLSNWLIYEYSEKPNSKTAKSWRSGISEGIKHPKIDQKLVDEIGLTNLIKQAEQLEEAGLISVKWKPFHKDLISIDFPMANMDNLYEYEQKENPKDVIRTQIAHITELKDSTQKVWLIQYFTSLISKLTKGDMPTNALDNDFLKCLYQLAKLTDYKWKRFFSRDVLGKSKTFENTYEGRILTVLRQNPEIPEDMSDYEVLAEYGILTYSQTLAWKGNLTYSIEGNKIDSSSMIYGTLLNAQTLVHSEPVAMQGVKKIITIENQANYEDMAYTSDTLFIFVHGFPSPKERNFLKCLTQVASEDTQYYHWGDMDLGGIRIFKFLKQELFPKLEPMKMDAASYREAIEAGQGIEFDEKKRKKYMELEAGELEELKQCILQYGKDIEQEGVRPR